MLEGGRGREHHHIGPVRALEQPFVERAARLGPLAPADKCECPRGRLHGRDPRSVAPKRY